MRRREARSVTLDVSCSDFPLTAPVEDIISTTLAKILEEREKDRLAQLNIDDYDREMNKKMMKMKAEQGDFQEFYEDLSCIALIVPPKSVSVKVYIGHDDGTIALIDLTEAIRFIGVGMIPKDISAASRVGYNPRRMCSRSIKYSDIQKFGWTPQDISNGKVHLTSPILKVWMAHGAAVTTLSMIGDNNDILSASDDFAVQLWTHGCEFKGSFLYSVVARVLVSLLFVL